MGDLVKIVRNFDNNTQTRRYPFDSFYEANNYEVSSILQNNLLKIKNLTNWNDIKLVHKGSLKNKFLRKIFFIYNFNKNKINLTIYFF